MDDITRARIRGQSGLLTRAQALAAGLSDRAIVWRLATGRWVAVHPGVYLTEPGRDDWSTRAVAALLAVGSPSALAGRSAAHAVLDCARGRGLDTAVALAARACQLRLTTPAELVSALSTRRDVAGGRLLVEALGETGSSESAAELRYLRDVERAHGLPAGARQAPIAGGRRRDVTYDEQRVVVEVDGRLGHDGWAGRVRDGVRDRASAREGWVTLRAFWVDVAGRPCGLAAEVADVLRARGWRGRPRRCRRGGCVAGHRTA